MSILGGHLAGWTEVDLGHAHAYRVKVTQVAGRPRATGLQLIPKDGQHPDRLVITGQTLRDVPVAQLVEAATRAQRFDFLGALGEAQRPPRPGPAGYGVEHWQQVADVWQQARAVGESTRKAIAAHWGVKLSTADVWIRRAKDAGTIREDN